MIALSKKSEAELPYYHPVAQECTLFETAHANGLPLSSEGADRLRQDAICGTHGGSAWVDRSTPSLAMMTCRRLI